MALTGTKPAVAWTSVCHKTYRSRGNQHERRLPSLSLNLNEKNPGTVHAGQNA
jgi:hypothetical protein